MNYKIILDNVAAEVELRSHVIAAEICDYLRSMNPGLEEVRSTEKHSGVMERLGLITPESVERGSYRLTEEGKSLREKLRKAKI